MNDTTEATLISRSSAELYAGLLAHLDRGDDLASLASHLLTIEALPADHPDRPMLLQTGQRAIALCQRLDQYQQKERALRAVFESAKALTELKSLNELLIDIVERGRRLLGSDLAWLGGEVLHSPGLHVLAAQGANTEAIRAMSVAPSAGIAGYVARTRSSFTTQDYLLDSRFVHDSNIDAAIKREGLQSVVAVPILSESEVIGILIVGDRYKRAYQPWEVSILATLAAHASVAVRNARTFELKQQALRDAERANRNLQHKIGAMELAADAHDRLAKQLARGSNFQEMVDVIADMLGGQVWFLDPAGAELCAACPESLEARGAGGAAKRISSRILLASEQSRSTGRSVLVDAATDTIERVAAVSSGEDHFGSLLIRTMSPLADYEVRIFERCATAMAVVALLAERRSSSVRQDASLTVRALVDESQSERNDLVERAKRHGLNPAAPMLLAVMEVERAKVSYVASRIAERIRSHPHIVSELDGRIVVLINRTDSARYKEELERTVFHDLKASGVACVSPPLHGTRMLPSAYEAAKRAIALMHKLRRTNRVVYEPELSVYGLLFHQHSREDLERMVDATIGPLLAYDAKTDSQLAETLSQFLDRNQNARATAKALRIHVNTVHNRLKAISAILGPWDADGRAVELHLALRLRALRAPQLR